MRLLEGVGWRVQGRAARWRAVSRHGPNEVLTAPSMRWPAADLWFEVVVVVAGPRRKIGVQIPSPGLNTASETRPKGKRSNLRCETVEGMGARVWKSVVDSGDAAFFCE